MSQHLCVALKPPGECFRCDLQRDEIASEHTAFFHNEGAIGICDAHDRRVRVINGKLTHIVGAEPVLCSDPEPEPEPEREPEPEPLDVQPPLKLTRRGELVLATLAVLLFLLLMAVVGGIEAGTLL